MTEYTLMPGKPFEGTEEETMQTIRAILTEEIEVPPARPQRKADRAKGFVDRNVGLSPRRRASDFPELSAQADVVAPKGPGLFARMGEDMATLSGHLTAFRPTTRHLAIVCTLLLMVVRPQWFVIGGILIAALAIGVCMTVGMERIWRGVLAWIARVEGKNPARGALLRARLDAFACKWDGFLDLFPDGLVDGLYMPDFVGMLDAEERHMQVMSDRLERMTQEG